MPNRLQTVPTAPDNVNLIMHDSTFSNVLNINKIKQLQRELCLYNEKRYLLANQSDGSPNQNTHAHWYRDLAKKSNLITNRPERGTELIIWNPKKRFSIKNARLTKRFECENEMFIMKKLPNKYADGELIFDKCLVTEQMEAAQTKCAI